MRRCPRCARPLRRDKHVGTFRCHYRQCRWPFYRWAVVRYRRVSEYVSEASGPVSRHATKFGALLHRQECKLWNTDPDVLFLVERASAVVEEPTE